MTNKESKGNKDMPYKANEYVSTTIAGEYIGVSRQAVNNMIRSGIIPAIKVYQDTEQTRYVYVIRFGDLEGVEPRTAGDRSNPQ